MSRRRSAPPPDKEATPPTLAESRDAAVELSFAAAQAAAAVDSARLYAAAQRETDERKRLESELRESDERFRAIFENSAMGMAMVGLDGRWLRVNDALCRITGYSREELLALSFNDIISPEDRAESWLRTQRVLTGEELNHVLDKRYQRKDGSLVPVRITVSLTRDAAGAPQAFISAIEDISQYKRIEMAQLGLRQVLELMIQGVAVPAVLNELVRVVERSSSSELMASIRLVDQQGRFLRLAAAPSLPDAYNKAVESVEIGLRGGCCGAAALRGEPVYVTDITQDPLWADARELAREHRLRACWSTPIRSRQDQRVVGTITIYYREPRRPSAEEEQLVELATRTAELALDRARAEQALRDSARSFREMIDALPAAIYTTDAEGRLTHFNRAAVEFSGRVPQIGTDTWCVSWKLYHPDGRLMPHSECPMAVALKEGHPVRGVEAIAERPDGSRIWFTPYPTPLRDASGRIIGGVNMLVDITARKQAEGAMSLLAAIVDSSDDAIISKNLDGTITSWNKSAERLFGYAAHEMIGKSVARLIPADRQDEEPRILERLRQGERVEHFETVRVRKDGTLLDISLTVSLIKDAQGRVIGASQIARDIGNLRRAQEALRASEAKFATGFGQSPLGLTITSLETGKLLEVNESLLEISGYTREEVIGRSPDEIGMWIEPELRRQRFEMFKRGERPPNIEARFRIKSGRELTALVASNLIEIHGQRCVLTSVVDITERKQAEAELRASQGQVAAFFDSTAVGAAILTPQCRFLRVNDAFCRILGYTRDEMLSLDCASLTHPEDRAEMNEKLDALLAGKVTSFVLEKRYQHKNGTEIWVQDSVSLSRDADGQPLQFVALCQDVSKRRDSERELLAVRNRLADELADTRMLQELSAQLVQEGAAEALYQKIMDTARGIMHADCASMQMLYPGRGAHGGLRLLASYGFSSEAAQAWEWVDIECTNVCGEALRTGKRVIVPDVELCSWVDQAALATFRQTSIRAVTTTPLYARSGRLVGMLSAHWRKPYHPAERDLRLFDIIARQAADLMERKQGEEALRRSEERQRFLAELAAATQALADPERIMAVTAQQLGQHLDVDRCAYAEVEADETYVMITGDYTRGVPSMVGRLHLGLFGEEAWRMLRENKSYITADVETDPRSPADRSIYHLTKIRAAIAVPLHKDGRLTAGMAVTHATVRQWDAEEIELVQLVVNRCWEAIERARAVRKLAASEARAQLALDVSGQGTWSWDPHTDMVEADVRCREICGLKPRGSLKLADVSARVHPEDVARVEKALTSALSRQGDGNYAEEIRFVHTDGSERWVLSRGQTRFAEANGTRRPEVMLGTMLDITDRKRTEAELKDADRRKDEFLATLAHELRNPLAPLRNSLHILRMSQHSGPAEPLHELMERQVSHMVRLVDDLLEVSRISRGKIELKRERVRLNALLYDVLETARPQIAAAGHQLTVTLPPETLILEADPVRLAQIFGNVLNNASKYTPAGGHIWLTVLRDEEFAVISVRDNGVGIPPEMLSRVFEVFTQVEHNLNRAQGGLGIGLSLVRNLLKIHGGSIEARSDGPGRGSEFIVRLPLAPERRAAANAATDAAAAEDAMAGGGTALRAPHRVLVVDDNRDAADSLGMLLRYLGADVKVAHSGAEGLATLEDHRPQVILLDLGMPGMDGFEVARRVRERCGQGVKLIALTGWGQEEDRRRTRAAGFDRHLIKPPELAALQALLAELDEAPLPPSPRREPEERQTT